MGDKVEARTGRKGKDKPYEEGKIIALWDAGNPYRIEIQDEKKTNVWGPIDDDRFVRAFTN